MNVRLSTGSSVLRASVNAMTGWMMGTIIWSWFQPAESMDSAWLCSALTFGTATLFGLWVGKAHWAAALFIGGFWMAELTTLVPDPHLGNDRTVFIQSVIVLNVAPFLATVGLAAGLFLRQLIPTIEIVESHLRQSAWYQTVLRGYPTS